MSWADRIFNPPARLLVALLFWLSKKAEPVLMRWANVTDDEGVT